MGNWFGGKKAVDVPGPVLQADPTPPPVTPAASAAGSVGPLGSKQVSRLAGKTQTKFGGKAQELGGIALGQSQYAEIARKALLGQ